MNQPQDPVITLSVPLSVINGCLTALADQPARISMGAIQLLQQQAQAWLQANLPSTPLVTPAPPPLADNTAA